MPERIAVVLFNLGGPDRAESVRPFLFNLFNDPAIIRLPGIVRTPLAYLIARRRTPWAQKNYGILGGGSPLLANTKAQAAALEARLAQDLRGDTVKCFVSMRYWHPMADETAMEVKDFAPDKTVLLPLYPQYSTTTSASSLRAWARAARAAELADTARAVCCYPAMEGFVAAMAQAVRVSYEQVRAQAGEASPAPRVLFSAHGLPQKVIAAGDPYQLQCEQTAREIVDALDIPGLDWVNCYQSRVGPLAWIGPYTDNEVRRAGAQRVPLVIAPIAFVSEHVETLVELDRDYRKLADACGVPAYARVPAAGVNAQFIGGLAGLVRSVLGRAAQTAPCPEGGVRICGAEFGGCPAPRAQEWRKAA
ncbi:MAG: ferrochelatase [Alphaproteobacteria bacterium]|nr:ferrochelatase [Alphaproteobacteria bacterium]